MSLPAAMLRRCCWWWCWRCDVRQRQPSFPPPGLRGGRCEPRPLAVTELETSGQMFPRELFDAELWVCLRSAKELAGGGGGGSASLIRGSAPANWNKLKVIYIPGCLSNVSELSLYGCAPPQKHQSHDTNPDWLLKASINATCGRSRLILKKRLFSLVQSRRVAWWDISLVLLREAGFM